MTTSTQSKKSTPAPAKRQTAKQKQDAAKAAQAAEAKAATTEATEPKAPAQPTYRDAENFTPALKAAKAAAKGNADLTNPLQLITHLAWKSPGGKVGWANNTTQAVMDFADEAVLPEGTPIPEALARAISLAEKAATEQPQKDAVAVLAKVIQEHAA